MVCNHPSDENFNDLLTLKIKDLKQRAKDLNIDESKYDARSSVSLKQAIWEENEKLNLVTTDVPVDKEDSKNI